MSVAWKDPQHHYLTLARFRHEIKRIDTRIEGAMDRLAVDVRHEGRQKINEHEMNPKSEKWLELTEYLHNSHSFRGISSLPPLLREVGAYQIDAVEAINYMERYKTFHGQSYKSSDQYIKQTLDAWQDHLKLEEKVIDVWIRPALRRHGSKHAFVRDLHTIHSQWHEYLLQEMNRVRRRVAMLASSELGIAYPSQNNRTGIVTEATGGSMGFKMPSALLELLDHDFEVEEGCKLPSPCYICNDLCEVAAWLQPQPQPQTQS